MPQIMSGDIKVIYPDGMDAQEALLYVPMGIEEWKWKGHMPKSLGQIVLTLDGDDVLVNPQARITRTRRITGYLSNVENFNDSKRAELEERVTNG